jgi:hypothetical protein
LAAVTVAEGPPLLVPSPITGIVVAANEQLADEPAVLVSDPCGRGWMACLRTAQFDEETNQCVPRRLVLANADVASADEQAERLMCLGCEVTVVRSRKELKLAAEGCVLLVDAASFAAEGPALVAEVNALAPSWKIVVADAADDLWETAYRKHRIFYYAVAPFADNEIADILDAAFRVPEPRRPRAERGKGTGELLSSISITHGGGQKVCLLAAPGLLRCNEGLAEQIVQKLTETGLSVTTTAGEMNLAPVTFVNKAAAFDRLIVLRIKDGGGLPGALSRGLPADCVPPSTEAAARVCWLSIQPDAVGGLGGLDSRTVAALAGHIVREMHSCGRPLG